MDILAEIYSRIKISDIISEYVKLTSKGHEKEGLCPFHREKTPSFSVNDTKGLFHCFGCGEGGNAISFLSKIKGISTSDALKILAQKAGVEIIPSDQPSQNMIRIRQINEVANKWFQSRLNSPVGEEARIYLKNRGISPHLIKFFELGWCASGALNQYLISSNFSQTEIDSSDLFVISEYSGRKERFGSKITFPIFNEIGNIVGFGGRTIINGAKPKYINSSDSNIFSKREILYGYRQCLEKPSLPLLIVEGYFDVISLFSTDKFRAVAPLGTALTCKQIQKAWSIDSVPIILFDGDEAGKKASLLAMVRAFEVISPGYSVRFAFLPLGFDPDTMVQDGKLDELENIIFNAIDLEEYMWNHVRDAFQIKVSPEEKALIYKKCMAFITKISDSLTKECYIENLKERMKEVIFRSYGGDDRGDYRDDNRRGYRFYDGDRPRYDDRFNANRDRYYQNRDRYYEQNHQSNRHARNLYLIYNPILRDIDFALNVRERFATFDVKDRVFADIRDDIIDQLDKRGRINLDKLIDMHGDIISDIMQHRNAEISVDSQCGMRLWYEAVDNYGRFSTMHKEVDDARRHFSQRMDADSWSRMKALRKDRVRFKHDSDRDDDEVAEWS